MTTFTNKYSNYLHYKYNMIYSMKYTWVLYSQIVYTLEDLKWDNLKLFQK